MSAKINAVVLHKQGGQLIVEEVDKPVPKHKPKETRLPGEHGELLVKVKTVALNPVDWKQAEGGFFIEGYPVTLGCDVAGIVEATVDEGTGFSVGDEVMAYAKLGTPGGYGAFSEYSLVEAATTFKKPPHLSWEQAASIPVGSLTAALGLYDALNLPLPTDNPSFFREEFILIWGGASSIGSYAVQLAVNTGLTVITTASPKNHDYLRSIGARHVIDYHASDVIDQINSITKNNLKYVLDTVNSETCNIGLKVLAQNGKLAYTSEGPTDKKEGVQVKGVALALVHKDSKGALETTHKLLTVIQQLLFEGRIQPNNIEVIDGGLNGIPAGLHRLKTGVSAKKLIVKID
ncbi:chaperonin 10-like protein [Glomus cerebriforme]|uniref:Chaperonin 10-like protein n=1 Tax=Glomus cerebriforme TaxID=658196 RepID=A0A397SP22_9GLOM|nr:chaperonin 10-like protein [Glomus cerebriforme]